jgi:SH3 domain protein
MLKTLFTLLLLSVTTLQAAHITDKLIVGLYETPDNSTKPLQVISSGTPLDVLKKEGGYSLVRLGDGKEGWIKSTYITAEKPAKAQLLELQAKTGELKQKLQQAEEKLKGVSTAAVDSSSSNSKLQQELVATTAKLEQAESYTEKLRAELDTSKRQIEAQAKALASAKQEAQTAREETKLLQSGNETDATSIRITRLERDLETSRKAEMASHEEVLMLQDHLKKLSRDAAQEKLAQAKILEINKELSAAKKELNAAALRDAESARVQSHAQLLQQRIKEAAALLDIPMDEISADGDNGSLFSPWNLLIMFLVLLGGFLGGVAFINYRVRKRYGGFRI